MNRILEKTLPLAALLMVIGVGSARAAVVHANVPFDFIVHGKTLRAGEYTIGCDDNEPSVLFIRGRDGVRTNLIVFTEPVGDRDPAGDQPALRFTKHGSEYYLDDIWRSRVDGWEIESPAAKK